MKLSPRLIAVALAVSWSCAHADAAPLLDVGQGAPLVYDVENTGADFPKPVFPSDDRLAGNKTLPDPFRSFDGRVDGSFGGWRRRRAELKAAIENYEIGPKPDPSDVDETASYANDTLKVVITRKSNGRSLTLTSPVFLPSGSGPGPFPAVIGMTGFCFGPCTGTGSLPTDIFISRDIARIPFFHNQVTTVSFRDTSKAGDPYFYLYPEYSVPGNIGQYSAWAWGVSRLIDGMEIAARQSVNPLPIDFKHLAVTGCSYAGKMALFAGALDERVALTIAQESGGGGAPAWRVSHAIEPAGTVEKTDNTSGTWFIRDMKTRFKGDLVYTLPHDHHELLAMVAPRALLVTGNTDFTWLSNRSAYVDARAAQEIYTELGIGSRFGFYIDGGHKHCAVPDSERPSIEAFVDKFLLGRDANTDVQVHPYADLEYRPWMPWSLRQDIALLVGGGSLTAGQGRGLSDKLNAALASVADGKPTAALNQLDAFVNRVNGLIKSHALTAEQGAALIAKAAAARARLGL